MNEGMEFSPTAAGAALAEQDMESSAEQEYRARMEYVGRDETYARRDPELQLLMFPENSEDINKVVVRVLERYTNFDKAEGNSPYKVQYYMEAADANVFIFGHSPKDLQDEGYVKGTIGEDGFLEEGGEPVKFGYAIKVEKEKKEITIKEQKEKRHEPWVERTKQTHHIPVFDDEGKIKKLQPVQVGVEIEHPGRIEKWEEVSHPTITIEKFKYGTGGERKMLENSSLAGYERFINTVRQHGLFEIMEGMRADIKGLTTVFYLKAKHISNDQFRQIFNSPDISNITPENLENNEYGTRINDAMRMMDLFGHTETKEEMEEFINKPTFGKIVDSVKKNALKIIDASGYKDDEEKIKEMIKDEIEGKSESEQKEILEKTKVARFLIGKGAIRKNGKWVLDGEVTWTEKDKDKKDITKTQKWKTKEERDPALASSKEREWWRKEKGHVEETEEERKSRVKRGEVWARGFAAKKYEERVRGFLTEYGNVYVGDKTDLMLANISLLLNDKNAVRDADRYFQILGLRDELNLQLVVDRDSLPSAEDIIAKHKVKGEVGYDDWREQADFWLEYFKLPGDPVSSDLSKIFYPQFYRLKDILRDRPAGPILTVHDYERFSQSMLSLGRSEVGIDFLDENGEIIFDENGEKIKQTRSILEQWRGYAAEGVEGEEGYMPREEAIDLGEFKWNAVQVPGDVMEVAKEMMSELKVDVEKELEEIDLKELPKEIKENIKKLLKEADGAVVSGLYTYYALMNWLAGRDNTIKAPWFFVIDETENLRELETMGVWTNKEKFLNIIWHGPALAWGDWRSLYKIHKTKEAVDKYLNGQEYENTQKGKRDWYKGVRNIPAFAKIMAQEVKVEVATKLGHDPMPIPMIEIIEGIPKKPGLAVKYGFLTKDEHDENLTKRLLREQDLR